MAKPVAVPANIGITAGPDHRANGISALHTHDTTGVVHIESPTAGQVFTLGQFLTEWGVLGGSGAPGTGAGPLDGWTLYVNGQKYDGGIRDLPLKAHDEIVLSYGSAPARSLPHTTSRPENELVAGTAHQLEPCNQHACRTAGGLRAKVTIE